MWSDIERALNTALNQDYPHLEIVVVDDKGQDGSMDIVREIQLKHPRGKCIRVVDHIFNQGTGSARNSGIDHAKGEYLYMMDSDDSISPSCITTLYKAMTETPVDFVTGSVAEVDAEGNFLRERRFSNLTLTTNDEILHFQYDTRWIKLHHTLNLMAPLWNRLYDIRFLRKNRIRCIPGQKIEDLVFTFRLLMKARSLRTISEVTYHYNMGREASTTKLIKKYSEDILKEDLQIVKSYGNFIPELRKRSRAVSSVVFASVLMKTSRTLYLAQHLKMDPDKYNALRRELVKYVNISWREIPKSNSARYFWIYLYAPSCFQKLLDLLFFDRKEKAGKL